jgi:hypothetical protein
MDGKFVTTLLNIFAVLALFGAIFGFIGLFIARIETLTSIALIVSGLFCYATLSALVVIILNLVQIRKNTDK